MERLRIGLDLDGTVVLYEQLFRRIASERLGMPAEVPARKTAIRAWVRGLPDGEARWVELQRLAYGPLMVEAEPAPGVRDFLRACTEAGVTVSVVSHRTPLSVAAPRVDLHAAARGWLERNGFFSDERLGLRPERVYLEPTRAAKIDRIRSEGLALFVDDLEEVFAERSFPPSVERWLYSPDAGSRADGMRVFSEWSALLPRVLELGTRMADAGVVAAAVRAALGRGPDSVAPIRGGKNNVVAKAVVDGQPLLAKVYFAHADDPRDRLGTEFAALGFLWDRGVRCIPRPIAVERRHGIGVYEFVDGEPLEPGSVSAGDGLQLAGLLARMWELRDDPEARTLPNASEACFSLRGYFDLLDGRLARLRSAPPSEGTGVDVHAFVEDELAPAIGVVRAFVEDRASGLGVDAEEEIAAERRTISPGDIGFQNALRRPDGSLVFVDFEYAGWDDPAHVLDSACLPPGVPLPREAHLVVLTELLARLGADAALAARVRLVYPILALKWALIVLNEFVPSDARRRAFAGASERPAAQIEKSRALLRTAAETAGDGSFLDALLVPA